MTGSKQVDYWTSGTVYECSEIAGSPQFHESLLINYMKMHILHSTITPWKGSGDVDATAC
jgi:hypothetical protein